jgi:signal transduction histidine kinase
MEPIKKKGKKEKRKINLKDRLVLTYTLFVSITFLVLIFIINHFSGVMFAELIKKGIAEQSAEMVSTITEQYDPFTGDFDMVTLEVMGMYFVHKGYIITIEGADGTIIWDARSCDMQQCAAVIDTITDRMENQYGLQGALQKQRFPVQYHDTMVASVTIESYGPLFYSENESQFLSSLNRLLLVAGLVFTIISVFISAVLASAIAYPIVRASEAARCIANGNRNIRIIDTYHTAELCELSQSINELAADLTEGERRQKQLMQDVAHELRTPLTGIQGNVEAMIDGVLEPTPQRLTSCYEEIIRLTKLVENLHILTSLEWKNVVLNKSSFDIAKLVQLVAEQCTPAAHEKGIAIVLRVVPALVTADYDRLKQVFINILSNAVKYTEQGHITLSNTERGEVTIADTGTGIPPDELPHIFERFYRADQSRNRTTGGAGIGLTIAAAIIAAHEGSITVESEPGKGSVFRINL